MPKVKKIVVIGPESTGKSTLTKGLSEVFGEPWVEEYARQYLQDLQSSYEYKDLLSIAKGQVEREDRKALLAKRFLFCDTDLQVVEVWSDHKFQKTHPWILEQIEQRHYDLYLLTDIDIPWQYDPLREHPDPAMRKYFFDIYQQLLEERNLPFFIISGKPHQRLHQAVNCVKSLALEDS